jgi:glutamyl-tRNA synthetase
MYEAGITKFIPQFGHLPYVMGEGNKKLSKRDPESNLFHHRDRGFIPEGLLNYLALLGWGLSADRDIFTLEELAANFEVTDVNPNPARFDQKKADAINAAHIRLLTPDDFRGRLVPYLQSAGVLPSLLNEKQESILRAAAPLVQERMTVLSEAVGLLKFLFISNEQLEIEEDALAGLPENAAEIAQAALEVIESLPTFDTASLQEALNAKLVEELGLKPRNAFGPVRTAISGRRVSPPLFESMEILGREESVARLRSFAQRG